MQINKLILLALTANTLSACSSPPKLSEPKGDWVSFESVPVQASAAPSYISVGSQQVDNVTAKQLSGITTPLIQPNSDKTLLVLSNGKNEPLYKAVRSVVPASWGIKLSPEVAQKFRGNVSWTGNDQWPIVLRKMLTGNNLEAKIDDRQKLVVIVYGKSPAFAAPVLAKSMSGKPVMNKPVVSKPVNPFAGTPPPTQSIIHSVVAASKPAVTQPVQTWSISKGLTLKEGIMSWAASEKCSASGTTNWTVLWSTPVNYRVDAPLRFSGNFLTALNEVFTLYQRAEKPLYAVTNTPQCLIRIEDK
ncbi:toxin co-regulated pilus biosynthesis Q family protein [Pantoea stewartii]|uniref:toxin co-regulated pilus biosynthesis Q family protein n=1 Tax=Pantoea stewartii TaxID=66269 RepID=UPI0025A150AC|nr:toxin co-regulated pilus biosynthesis Q family protein [Pantoea stewartii]